MEFNHAEMALKKLNINIKKEDFTIEQLLEGMDCELEHGTEAGDMNITDNDPVKTAKIAIVHLRECPEYYDHLEEMEMEEEEKNEED